MPWSGIDAVLSRRTIRPIAVFLLLALGACDQVVRLEGTDGPCIPPAVQDAFDRSCARAGCHDADGSGAGLSLTSGASAGLLSATSSQTSIPLVTIGDLDGSYLAHKLLADPPTPIMGGRMPVGYDPTNAEQVQDVAMILAWIAGTELAGCASAGGDTGGDAGDDATGVDDTGGGTASPRGLPCAVDELLQARCRTCHSDPPVGGAPVPLVTRDDLLAASSIDPQMTLAERSAIRMADPAAPMPPAPATGPTAEELAAFEAWLAQGTPAGTCDAGDEPNPFAVEPRCSTGVFWDREDDGDPLMHPGRDCLGCHDEERLEDPDDEDIPDLVIAGTVYATGHEPDDCYGESASSLRVVVRSMASGAEVELTPGASGNFLLHRASAPAGLDAPFSVKLVDGDRERAMVMPAPDGRCNACHTQDGAMNAPGRVVAP